MMKKLLLAILMLFCGMAANADALVAGNVIIGKFRYSVYDDDNGLYAWIEGPTDDAGRITEIIIPDEIDYEGQKVKVTHISSWGFNNMPSLRKVTIGANVRIIGELAFSGDNNCTFSGGANVEYIGDWAFYSCALKEFPFSRVLRHIGERAFEQNSFEIIKIPQSVEYIGDYAFDSATDEYEGCTMGIEFENASALTPTLKIGKRAFEGAFCDAFEIPARLDPGTYDAPGSNFLVGLNNIYTVNINPAHKNLKSEMHFKIVNGIVCAENSDSSKDELLVYSIPLSFESSEATIEGGRIRVLSGALDNSNIEKINLTSTASATEGQSNITVDDSGLGCNSITGITFTVNGDMSLNPSFTGDPGLWEGINIQYVDVRGNPTNFLSGNGVLYKREIGGLELFHYPRKRGLSVFDVPDEVTVIGHRAFFYNSQLQRVILPDALERIGDYAFSYSRISDVSYTGNGLNYAGRDAFYDCPFTDMSSPGPVMLGSCMVAYNGDIPEELIFPESIKSMGDALFYNKKMRKIVFPSGLKRIPLEMFEHCENLESVTWPEKLEEIGNMAFYANGKLESAILPATCLRIGEEAFNLCESIREIQVGDLTGQAVAREGNVIGKRAFGSTGHCKSLKLGSGFRDIGMDAFFSMGGSCYWSDGEDWDGELVIPEGIRNIGEDAFNGATNVKRLIIPSTLETCGIHAFKFQGFPLKEVTVKLLSPPVKTWADPEMSDWLIFLDSDMDNATLIIPRNASIEDFTSNPDWNFAHVVHGEFSSVDGPIVDRFGTNTAPASYYTLEGIRVENPRSGIYIRRQGSKTEKVHIR